MSTIPTDYSLGIGKIPFTPAKDMSNKEPTVRLFFANETIP
jgi:hypothetical protein